MASLNDVLKEVLEKDFDEKDVDRVVNSDEDTTQEDRARTEAETEQEDHGDSYMGPGDFVQNSVGRGAVESFIKNSVYEKYNIDAASMRSFAKMTPTEMLSDFGKTVGDLGRIRSDYQAGKMTAAEYKSAMNHTRGEIVGKMLEMGSSRKSILEDVFLRSVGIGPEERSIHSFRDLVDAFREEEVDPVDSLYSPKPAIRIIKHSYHRHDDRDYEFLCDKCGKTFKAKSPKDAEYEKELCICPHCGFSICFTPSTYYKSKEEYALDEHCQGYSYVFTDIGKRLAPTFVVFETVVFDEKRYFLVRRFHFELKQGAISKTKLYRGLIIPENEQDNYAALYENDFYELTSSSTENPFDWFDTSKYHMPHLGEFFVSEEAKPYAENMNGLKEILRVWCKWLDDSI